MTYKIAGVDSIIIYFGESICEETADEVFHCFRLLQSKMLAKKIEGIKELIPSYTSLFIQFELSFFLHDELFNLVIKLLKTRHKTKRLLKVNTIKIPVYYGTEVGYDLQRVAKFNNLSIEDVIRYHSSKTYRVFTIGFAPGFGYLGEADEKITTPRLESPRKLVPKGSVALADKQTAIYPKQSPGGWNILGRTYLEMFDKSLPNYSYLNIGDKVEFVSITKEEFLVNGGVL